MKLQESNIIIISGDKENAIVNIPINTIVKILAYFGRQVPVLFIYVKPIMGANIRRILKMTDKSSQYFDPCSTSMFFPQLWLLIYIIIL